MSVPSAHEAIEIAKKVRLSIQDKIKTDMDKDHQMLKEKTVNLIKTLAPDAKNYYKFKVSKSEFTYSYPESVLKQYINYMNSLGYRVADIDHKSTWISSNESWNISFRPLINEEIEN